MSEQTPDWRPVVGYEGIYEVTRCGRIRRLKIGKLPRELKTYLTPSGYRDINLYKNQKMRGRRVHRLVLESFVGPCPEGMEARHLNGVRSDCRLENLAWGTRHENTNDKILHGTMPRGERHWHVKLSEAAVREIKDTPYTKGIITDFARKYGVSLATISRVRAGSLWAWLDQQVAA